jgi:2,5-diamino-6-(ribosylamino)-4(3H)-pyrimidinone 5'-phosphate reductase
MNNLPITTLFMLMSVDGKISTGSNDDRDFDKDLPNVKGVGNGLSQYYGLEEETDEFSFNTGRVMAKVGWNDEKANIEKIPVTFVIVDNKPHLTELGVSNLLKRTEKLILVTTNKEHPAYKFNNPELKIIFYDGDIDFLDLFKRLKKVESADRITIQSGGEMNSLLVKEGLISQLSIVVIPALVGGKDTPTLMDGESLKTSDELKSVKALALMSADKLDYSYLHLRYKVIA